MRDRGLVADLSSGSSWPLAAALLAFMAFPVAAPAADYCSESGVETGLCSPSIFRPLNPFEQAAAAANQAVFTLLERDCGDSANLGNCPAATLAVFEAVREFVHTANALSGDPFAPTEFSLDLDLEGLGFALRWSAAEEMAAQGGITSRFAASQLNVLAARIADLRWGASGVRTALVRPGQQERVLIASTDPQVGEGPAGADNWVASRWSGFVDAAFGWGDREDTTFSGGFENAFDFDGKELNLGLDYRVSNSLVAGGTFGYSDKEVDFDSSLSIVDGDIESSGYSGQLFVLREGERTYLSGSLGYQRMDHDVRRRIVYPSNNANIAATDSTALSSTESRTWLASLGAGYQLGRGSLTAEPYVDLMYADTSIDGFVERSFSTGGESQEDSPDPFALAVGSQDVESLDSAAGVRMQYVLTPGFGVLIPYLHAAYHRELLDDTRIINSTYAGAEDAPLASPPGAIVVSGSNFGLPTDEPDNDYWSAALGFSVVLPNGLQGFVQYFEVFDLDFYNQSVVSAGFRYEF